MQKISFLITLSLLFLSSQAGMSATPEQAAQLNSTLTPVGAERAGSADGIIPAWTGGMTTVPAGWTPDQQMPDPFASEKPYLTINAGNMAQYKDRLPLGIMVMMQKYGYSIDVYPTHRTAAFPQFVQAATAQNALNAKAIAQGIRFGFTGAYAGPPFPIPDNNADAGTEIVWNHLTSWFGQGLDEKTSAFTVSDGVPALAATLVFHANYPYYFSSGNLAGFNGIYEKVRTSFVAPPELDGQEIITVENVNPAAHPALNWELLVGQGRVRKAPELVFDTPSSLAGGLSNFDEIQGFTGSPEQYNWKLLGKAEMYIPYNNNGLVLHTPQEILMPHFVNPQYVRWELHRVWIVDGTLASGERNVIAHRRFYIDEDTWRIAAADEWDAQGNIWKTMAITQLIRPELPGDIYDRTIEYNLQSDQYVVSAGPFADQKYGGPLSSTVIPDQMLDPNLLAAQAQY